MPTPGEHTIVPWRDTLQAREAGWVLRDTLLVLGPEGLQAWALMRWPLDGTVAETTLKHGCGGINIDVCRIRHASQADLDHHRDMVARIKERGGSMANSWKNSSDLSGASEVSMAGRWPPNVLLVHGPGCFGAALDNDSDSASRFFPQFDSTEGALAWCITLTGHGVESPHG